MNIVNGLTSCAFSKVDIYEQQWDLFTLSIILSLVFLWLPFATWLNLIDVWAGFYIMDEKMVWANLPLDCIFETWSGESSYFSSITSGIWLWVGVIILVVIFSVMIFLKMNASILHWFFFLLILEILLLVIHLRGLVHCIILFLVILEISLLYFTDNLVQICELVIIGIG